MMVEIEAIVLLQVICSKKLIDKGQYKNRRYKNYINHSIDIPAMASQNYSGYKYINPRQ
ncbi:hypothetical protein [Peribacillus sp. SCS-155]|uniref:hypothetical protein n=1 Tax=Peribacillus sedimenti TaxID=3115297 RepID=UPI003905A737